MRLIRRQPPNGVGRALRDGYAAATGRYILTMDCDFVLLVPELRDLFDRVAAGREGAIGSRFSYESVLINYPFFKILCNRAFHLLVKLTLLGGVRDVSNNLKLYRADILKTLDIEEPHFAANMETGLKPLLAGYDIRGGAGVLDQPDGRHGRLLVPHRQGGARLLRGADAHDLARVARPARFQQAADVAHARRAIPSMWRDDRAMHTAASSCSRTAAARHEPRAEDRAVGEPAGGARRPFSCAADRCPVAPLLAVTIVFAQRKLMWNDELYTYYMARLPSMSDVWAALMSGGEQTPPFFYWTTRVSFALFGVNNLSVRLPEMLGFWVMLACPVCLRGTAGLVVVGPVRRSISARHLRVFVRLRGQALRPAAGVWRARAAVLAVGHVESPTGRSRWSVSR